MEEEDVHGHQKRKREDSVSASSTKKTANLQGDCNQNTCNGMNVVTICDTQSAQKRRNLHEKDCHEETDMDLSNSPLVGGICYLRDVKDMENSTFEQIQEYSPKEPHGNYVH